MDSLKGRLPHGSPILAGLSSILTVAIGSNAGGKVLAVPDFEKLNRQSLGDFFKAFNDNIQSVVDAYFEGDFEKAGFEPPKFVDYITAPLKSGAMLSNSLVSQAHKEYHEHTSTRIKQALVINTLKASEHDIWQVMEIKSQKDCEDDKKYIWAKDRCNVIGKPENNNGPGIGGGGIGSRGIDPLSDKKWEAFTEEYKFNPEEFIMNALECGDQEEKETDWASTSWATPDSYLPVCFVNLSIRELNY